MFKLFAVFLGGRADGCNIELHDVVFAIGDSLENTYPILINKWFGNKKRLHIDSSIELKYIDDHEIIISDTKINQDKKLYFVNFGGYQDDHFGEIHQSGFFIGSSKAEVLKRAKNDLCVKHKEAHCDDNIDIDDIIMINNIDNHFIYLKPSTEKTKTNITSGYRKL